ncbi:hypothetical protein LX36DRAFT_245591 [Colletotrichum falcatum]|nr:hypothetical protein LX36DRAFT_245591 [Colletotrichum falcatum]
MEAVRKASPESRRSLPSLRLVGDEPPTHTCRVFVHISTNTSMEPTSKVKMDGPRRNDVAMERQSWEDRRPQGAYEVGSWLGHRPKWAEMPKPSIGEYLGTDIVVMELLLHLFAAHGATTAAAATPPRLVDSRTWGPWVGSLSLMGFALLRAGAHDIWPKP